MFFKFCFPEGLFEGIPAEVGEGDEEVHEYADLYLFWGFVDDPEDVLNDDGYGFGLSGEGVLAGFGVDHVSEHSGGEVEAEHVYLGVKTLLDQAEHPGDHLAA